MKTTVTLHGFREAFAAIRPDNFSYEGLELLFNWYEELEAETGEEQELDVIAICCDWCESAPETIMQDFDLTHDDVGADPDCDEDELADAVREYLFGETIVAGMTDEGNIVYLSF